MVNVSAIEIEDMVDDDANKKIQKELKLDSKPSKKQLSRYFQESLVREEVIDLSEGFKRKSKDLLRELARLIDSC